MTAVAIRGTTYPVLLPKLRDPRLHLAATIISLQVIGQVGFHFDLSIAQILISLATCAVLEVAIAFRTQKVLLWPASALLTGNGVAFVLRVPGTQHGDWWSLRGWPIYVGTAAFSLLSKHLIKWKGEHVFNPSNIGLVLCFLLLGRTRANPLDFWWGPMSVWLALALAVILLGGFTILGRLKLLRVALGFWAAFALGIGVLALAGHAMVARWHLGPISGFHFWLVLVTSPEVLVFLFFMITDPKTAPRSPAHRLVYAVSLGLLASLMIAPTTSEFAAKVALLGSLAVVCLAIPILRALPVGLDRRLALVAAPVVVAAVAGMVVFSSSAGATGLRPSPSGELPPIEILPSQGVETTLDMRTAKLIAHDLLTVAAAPMGSTLRVHLVPGEGQGPPIAVAQLAGHTYRLQPAGQRWALAKSNPPPSQLANVKVDKAYRFQNVAADAGLTFTQGAFRYGVTNDTPAMMGGGLCWLDYNNDGWLDLFVVNSYGEGDIGAYDAHGGRPTTQLFRNDHGHFSNVTAQAHAGEPVRGEGCVAADLNGDGYTDLFVTTAQDDVLLWNNGNGTFTEGARSHGIVSFGWHSGAAVADVNGDGRPDLFVAGYTEANGAIPSSTAGFPTNHLGVRDELFLNRGGGRFEEVGVKAGIDPAPYDHSLGAIFADFNGDGRPDLYVANDEDPNKLYLNEPGGPLGFHFVNAAAKAGVGDPNAGMGIAWDGRQLFVSNSRGQQHASYVQSGPARFDGAPGPGKAAVAGWGASWIDVFNDGGSQLALANGSIPISNLAKNAQRTQIFTHGPSDSIVDVGLLESLRVNGRGLAAADYDNDGRVDFAVNTIGGPLLLLRNTSAAGNWLEVALPRFAPGAVVTATLPDGTRQSHVVLAGSSYLSSEDPRVHFGLGDATRVKLLTVRYPDGRVARMRDVAANRIVTAP